MSEYCVIWEPRFIFAADDDGSRPLFAIAPNGDISVASLSTQGTHGSISVSQDGKHFAFTLAKLNAPNEVYFDGMAEAKGDEARNVSHANDKLFAELDLGKAESVKIKIGD